MKNETSEQITEVQEAESQLFDASIALDQSLNMINTLIELARIVAIDTTNMSAIDLATYNTQSAKQKRLKATVALKQLIDKYDTLTRNA